MDKKIINFKPQVFFIDIDGTLLDESKSITGKEEAVSKQNIDAINKCIKLGYQIVLSTGRAPEEKLISDIFKQTDIKYAVCQNGSAIINNKLEVVKSAQLCLNRSRAILKYCKEHNLYMIVNNTKFIYGPNTNIKLDRPWVKNFKASIYDEMPKVDHVKKLLVFGKDLEGMVKIKEELIKKIKNLSIAVVSYGLSLEITDIKASKGKANLFIAKYLGADPKRCLHIGDSGNDVSAAEFIGGFIAMGDAADFVKEKAMYVGPSYRPAGISKLLQMIMNDEI